ncbi:MAG: DUF7149 domain-containing protein [Bacteroidia bacterium]
MKLITQTPKKALKAFLKQKPLRSEIDVFKTNLIALLDKISVIEKRPKDESEEHLKTYWKNTLHDHITPTLRMLYSAVVTLNLGDEEL